MAVNTQNPAQPTSTALQPPSPTVTGFTHKLDTSRTTLSDKLAQLKAGPEPIDPETKKPTGEDCDQSLIELAKKCVLDRAAALPEQFDGALVVITGQQDLPRGRSSFTVQIYGKMGHL